MLVLRSERGSKLVPNEGIRSVSREESKWREGECGRTVIRGGRGEKAERVGND